MRAALYTKEVESCTEAQRGAVGAPGCRDGVGPARSEDKWHRRGSLGGCGGTPAKARGGPSLRQQGWVPERGGGRVDGREATPKWLDVTGGGPRGPKRQGDLKQICTHWGPALARPASGAFLKTSTPALSL